MSMPPDSIVDGQEVQQEAEKTSYEVVITRPKEIDA